MATGSPTPGNNELKLVYWLLGALLIVLLSFQGLWVAHVSDHIKESTQAYERIQALETEVRNLKDRIDRQHP